MDAPPTAQDRFRDALRDNLAPGLRSLGFKGSGNRYELPSSTHWLVLGIQKSARSNAENVRFTLNLKAVSREEWDQVRDEHSWANDKPDANTMGGSAWARIGTLVSGEDTWWSLGRDDDRERVMAEVVKCVEHYGLPWFREQGASQ